MNPIVFGRKNGKKWVILPIGAPGSGKSTFFRKYVMDGWKFPPPEIGGPIEYISADLIRFRLLGYPVTGIFYKEELEPTVRKIFYIWFRILLNRRCNIYIDCINLTRKVRSAVTALPSSLGYGIIMVYFDLPPDIILKRNRCRERVVPEEVVKDYIKITEFPGRNEFDYLFTVNENEEVRRIKGEKSERDGENGQG